MNKFIFLFTVTILYAVTSLQAQTSKSLKDLFNSSSVKEAVSAVASKLTGVTDKDLQGTWKYVSPACAFTSEDLLKKAGGAIVAESVSDKLESIYSKIGIAPGKFSYSFADSTFTNQLAKRQFKGLYVLDTEKQEVELQYQLAGLINLGHSAAKVEKSGNNIKLLFNADKLLQILTKLTATTQNTTLKTINTIAGGYDGMLIGFELSK